MQAKTGLLLALCITVALCAFAVGILIGYFSRISEVAEDDLKKIKIVDDYQKSTYRDYDDDRISQEINKRMNPDNIRNWLKFLSDQPHLAGTDRDNELATYIRDEWLKQGLDDVKLVPYDILLSYPDQTNPNKVQLLSEGKVVFETQFKEKTLRAEDEDPNFVHAFNAYAPKGNVVGDLVYVNYGRNTDFDELEDLGIDVKGKICIMRYGKIYRGNKVTHAQEHGAIGAILFLDPIQVALNGTDPKDVYPNSWWMPGTAMQRGSINTGHGDPMTPGYPSIDGVYRLSEDELVLPSIPAQPIGYSDAMEFLKIMGGPASPKNWTGKLPIDYNIGPGFNDQHKDKKVRLIVNNENRQVKSYNVIGTIKGEVEPDRYVLIGNHRDAWGYGAIDASTGTSQLLEVTRVLGQLHNEGWKPRRTMLFCSWGAEEYALIGSYEFVEDNLPKLQDRAVAYINVDICASGDALELNVSPILHHLALNAAKLVEAPKSPQKSVYDVYMADNPNKTELELPTPGSGSDHAPFAFYAGVPVAVMWWRIDKKKYDISTYPAYHTGYETFFLVDKYIDPGFKIHQSCSRMSGQMLHQLADSLMIPYNATHLGLTMELYLEKLDKKHSKTLADQNLSFDKLKKEIQKFITSAEEWHQRANNIDKMNPSMVRSMNDQLMHLERAFIKGDGLPDRPHTRHMIFAPSKFDSYSGGAFPAVSDLLYGIKTLQGDEKKKRWKKLERHLSDLLVVIHYATHLLQPMHQL